MIVRERDGRADERRGAGHEAAAGEAHVEALGDGAVFGDVLRLDHGADPPFRPLDVSHAVPELDSRSGHLFLRHRPAERPPGSLAANRQRHIVIDASIPPTPGRRGLRSR